MARKYLHASHFLNSEYLRRGYAKLLLIFLFTCSWSLGKCQQDYNYYQKMVVLFSGDEQADANQAIVPGQRSSRNRKKNQARIISRGAGMIVGASTDNIYIVTADHVLFYQDNPKSKIAQSLQLFGQGSPLIEFKVLFRDTNLDLAVVSIKRQDHSPLSEVQVESTTFLPEGIKMVCIGHPKQDLSWNINQENHLKEDFETKEMSSFSMGQIGIAKGNSGGPVFTPSLNSRDSWRWIGILIEKTGLEFDLAYGLDASKIMAKLDQWDIPFNLLKQPTSSKGMSYIPGGYFWMGDNAAYSDLEKPSFYTAVDDFLMDTHEITKAAFKQFVDDTAYKTTAERRGYSFHIDNGATRKIPDIDWKTAAQGNFDDRSVTHVSWIDAINYCNWRSRKENLAPCYSMDSSSQNGNLEVVADYYASGYRLPTEAEWEFAAKGGRYSKLLDHTYAGGNNPAELGWYQRNTRSIQVTGLKKPNVFQLHDLSGNVAEWTDSWIMQYKFSKLPEWNLVPSQHSFKVVRGGSYLSPASHIKNVSRRYEIRMRSHSDLGFRCVRRAIN